MSEQNKRTVERALAAWNDGDRETARELFAPGFDSGYGHADREAFFESMQLWRDALDARYEIEDLLAEEDKVAVRFTVTGTHVGPFAGVEPTGESLEFGGMAIFRLEEGRIVEQRAVEELGRLYAQVGAVDWPS